MISFLHQVKALRRRQLTRQPRQFRGEQLFGQRRWPTSVSGLAGPSAAETGPNGRPHELQKKKIQRVSEGSMKIFDINVRRIKAQGFGK